MADELLMEKFKTGVSLLCWGYNEELLIEDFLQRALAFMDEIAEDYEVVFVNDGSTDRTGAIADDLAKRNPHLRVVHHEVNKNVGFACRTAVASARKEILFWQTVDWSYDLTNARIFLKLMGYYDVVQGIRPVPIRLVSYIPVLRSIYRVKSRSDNLQKAIISLSNYYLLRILFGVNFHDFQNVTFYRTAFVQGLEMTGTTSFVNPEFLIRAYGRGARFIEVPIPFIKRTLGEAKGTKLKTVIRSVKDTLKNWLRWGVVWRLQGKLSPEAGRIQRVAAPFALDMDVLRLCLPLFNEFRHKAEDGSGQPPRKAQAPSQVATPRAQ